MNLTDAERRENQAALEAMTLPEKLEYVFEYYKFPLVLALIAVVGRRMSSKPGTSGKLFAALGEKNVNIRTIKQGADELSIMIGVKNEDFEKALKALYEEFAG